MIKKKKRERIEGEKKKDWLTDTIKIVESK